MAEFKMEVLEMLSLKKNKWIEIKKLKEKGEQNVVHENFIDDMILALDWVINDIEKMRA